MITSGSSRHNPINGTNAIMPASGDAPVETPRTPINSSSRDERRLKRNRTPTDLRAEGEGTRALLASDNEDEDDIRSTTGRNDVLEKLSGSKVIEPVKIFSTKSLNTGKENMGVKDWMRLPQFYCVSKSFFLQFLSKHFCKLLEKANLIPILHRWLVCI